MSERSRAKRIAAHFGWPYQKALQQMRDLGAAPMEYRQEHGGSYEDAVIALVVKAKESEK